MVSFILIIIIQKSSTYRLICGLRVTSRLAAVESVRPPKTGSRRLRREVRPEGGGGFPILRLDSLPPPLPGEMCCLLLACSLLELPHEHRLQITSTK